MPYSPAASVAGVSLRVTRLDAEGNLLNGPTDSYLTTAFIRVSFTPEYEEGDEITEKAADGTVCVSFKAPDTLKRVNMEIAVCDPDPELSALLSGGLILSQPKDSKNTTGGDIAVGWASAQVGEDPSGNGVAEETWFEGRRQRQGSWVLSLGLPVRQSSTYTQLYGRSSYEWIVESQQNKSDDFSRAAPRVSIGSKRPAQQLQHPPLPQYSAVPMPFS